MTTWSTLLRLTAVVLVVTLSLTLAAPARAEAVEPLLIMGIASAAVVVVILVVYLIVANTRDSRKAAEAPTPTLMVCVETPGQPTHCSSAAGTLAAGEGPVPQS
jgi:hypothetical protein